MKNIPMKLNNPEAKPFSLSENSQFNPLRWHLLYKEGDGSFTDQTGVFKCKDYFNDFVAKYLGLDTLAYGMDTTKIKLNEEGTYILLTGLTGIKQFLLHLEIISQESKDYGFTGLAFSKEETNVLLFIPRDYYVSTYIISFLTYLIRIAHKNSVCESFKQLTLESANVKVDQPFRYHHNAIMAASFEAPVKDEWILVGKTYKDLIMNGKSIFYSTSIHNAGCYNWMYSIKNGLV